MQRRDNSGPTNPIGAPASAQGSATERPERGERPSGERHGGERPERHGGHFGDRPGGERPERPGGHFGDRPGGHFHSDRPGGGPPRGGRGRDFRSRRKVCMFCVEHIRDIDYKDVAHLRRYLSDRGKIEPRRKTGTCAKHQRRLSTALKNARVMALLPYTAVHIRGS